MEELAKKLLDFILSGPKADSHFAIEEEQSIVDELLKLTDEPGFVANQLHDLAVAIWQS